MLIHGHYNMTRKENQMKELLELYDKMDELRDAVAIENKTDNPLVDAYNQGVDGMVAKIRWTINQMALGLAFGGEK